MATTIGAVMLCTIRDGIYSYTIIILMLDLSGRLICKYIGYRILSTCEYQKVGLSYFDSCYHILL